MVIALWLARFFAPLPISILGHDVDEKGHVLALCADMKCALAVWRELRSQFLMGDLPYVSITLLEHAEPHLVLSLTDVRATRHAPSPVNLT